MMQCCRCKQCKTSLVNQRFVIKGELVFCSKECKEDYGQEHAGEPHLWSSEAGTVRTQHGGHHHATAV